MAKPIEMPFELWARVGRRNHVLDGGPEVLRRDKVEHGCTTTNLPVPNGIKSLSKFNNLMVIPRSQTLPLNSTTDKKQHFCPYQRVKSKPQHIQHSDRLLKLFLNWKHIFDNSEH